jgi:hypothetical protein
VCEACGFGLFNRAPVEAVPGPDAAFVIVDASLSVQAMSRTAERVLGANEGQAVNRHVTELLLPADPEAKGRWGLAPAITRAASGDDAPADVFVRPGATFGVRLRALIAPCGPPRAALVVLS